VTEVFEFSDADVVSVKNDIFEKKSWVECSGVECKTELRERF
jgi:hypothetical protein